MLKINKKLLQLIVFGIFCINFNNSRLEDRYDLNNLPFDLRPVKDFVGLWEMERVQGHYRDMLPPNKIDFAINPIPRFGARTINITHKYFDKSKNLIRSDYGFMPVQNATRRDPRIHLAYLTTSSDGFSLMEQGFYKDKKLILHLKQFLKRSFGVGSNGDDFEIREFERQFEIIDFHRMSMKVRAETNFDTENYIAFYKKILF